MKAWRPGEPLFAVVNDAGLVTLVREGLIGVWAKRVEAENHRSGLARINPTINYEIVRVSLAVRPDTDCTHVIDGTIATDSELCECCGKHRPPRAVVAFNDDESVE